MLLTRVWQRVTTKAATSSLAPSIKFFSSTPKETIFGKIIDKKIKADIVYEDEQCLAFRDISPQAPTHIILVPKTTEIPRLSQAQEKHKNILGHLLYTASVIAKQEKLAENGWRLVINDGKYGQQTVEHIHLHIIGGRQFRWPPG